MEKNVVLTKEQEMVRDKIAYTYVSEIFEKEFSAFEYSGGKLDFICRVAKNRDYFLRFEKRVMIQFKELIKLLQIEVDDSKYYKDRIFELFYDRLHDFSKEAEIDENMCFVDDKRTTLSKKLKKVRNDECANEMFNVWIDCFNEIIEKEQRFKKTK